jgi:hypothetical protein
VIVHSPPASLALIRLGKLTPANSPTHCIYDIKYQAAAVLKCHLHADSAWSAFLTQATATGKQLQQKDMVALGRLISVP